MLVLCLLIIVFVLSSCSVTNTTTTITYNPNTILKNRLSYDKKSGALDNPAEGYAKRIDLTWAGTEITGMDYSPNEGFYFLLNDLSFYSKKTNKISDREIIESNLSDFRKILNQFKENNCSVVVRFTYDSFENESGKEPSFDYILGHLASISKVINEFPNTVLAFESGFISNLGSGIDDSIATFDNMDRLIETYFNNVTETKLFVPRVDYIYHYLNIDKFTTINTKLAKQISRFGIYDNGQLIDRIINNNFDENTIYWSLEHGINLAICFNDSFDVSLIDKVLCDKLFKYHLTYFTFSKKLEQNFRSNIIDENGESLTLLNYLNKYSGYVPLIKYFDVVNDNGHIGYSLQIENISSASFLKDIYYTIEFRSEYNTITFSDILNSEKIEKEVFGLTSGSYEIYFQIYDAHKKFYISILNNTTILDNYFYLGKIIF